MQNGAVGVRNLDIETRIIESSMDPSLHAYAFGKGMNAFSPSLSYVSVDWAFYSKGWGAIIGKGQLNANTSKPIHLPRNTPFSDKLKTSIENRTWWDMAWNKNIFAHIIRRDNIK